MSSENKTPSLVEVQRLIREKTVVEVLTLDAKSSRFAGTIKWFDGDAFHLKLEDGSEITILRHAVLGIRAKKAK
ncbi:MAG: hypothetical protein LCH63_09955 [Candidatus Melainabacteria bacterium]|mgnify:CR=1 FL=1|jgi:hypothetical protein|uniref:Hfq-related domain-containing protein n=1 Tax=Candidatus Obscuribacter phosphatis TaxID=1906157 RepID=A0A8J7TLC2_9BACT|nr:hypothetical protein [Candidatus Obscuribacter phosphatis]MCA0314148.1 hypothetical protein [Candidatus Melainabacteria bacterium]